MYPGLFAPFLLSALLICLSCRPGTGEEEKQKSAAELEDVRLVEQLGAPAAEERAAAEEIIWKKGAELLPLLDQAALSVDPEIATRAADLALRIRTDIPRNARNPLSMLLEAYSRTAPEKKITLVNAFFNRRELTMEEARSALILMDGDSDINTIPYSFLSRFRYFLENENIRLLNEGKINEACELWNNITFCPEYRHRYAAMLFHSGQPLDLSLFPEQNRRLLEIDYALLNRDKTKIRELAPAGPTGDAYIDQRLSAINFDLKGLWKKELDIGGSLRNCPQDLLMIYYSLAVKENDQKTLDSIRNRLIENLTETASHNFINTLNDYSYFSPKAINAARLLLGFGEIAEAHKFLSQIEHTPLISPFFLDYPALTIFSMAMSPDFDPKQLGAREDTLDAILECAGKISPPGRKSFNMDEDADTSNEITLRNANKKLLVQQRILALTYYLAARGDAEKIYPFLFTNIEENENPEEAWADCCFFLSAFLASGHYEMAYQVYSRYFHRQNHLEEHLIPMEQMLYMGQMLNHLGKDIPVLSQFIDSLSPEVKTRDEKMRKILVLLHKLPGTPGEEEELFVKALAWIKSEPDRAFAEEFTRILLRKYLEQRKALGHFFRLLDAWGKPVVPMGAYQGDHFEFFYHVYHLGSEQLKNQYRDYLKNILSASKTIFPSSLKKNEEETFPAPDTISFAEYGTYLALLTDDKAEAARIRNVSGLYAPSESEKRMKDAVINLPAGGSIEDALFEMFPEYNVPPDIVTLLSRLHLSGPRYSMMMVDYLLAVGKYREATYLLDSSSKYLAEANIQNRISLNTWLIVRSLNEMSRGLLSHKEGKKQQALTSLKKSLDICRQANSVLFYSRMALMNEPSLKPVLDQWYEEERSRILEILGKWPHASQFKSTLILNSLILDKHREETAKMISETTNEKERHEYRQFSRLMGYIRAGESRKAAALARKQLQTGSDFHSLWFSFYDYLGIRK